MLLALKSSDKENPVQKSRPPQVSRIVGKMTLVNMKGIIYLVTLTILIPSSNLVEAQLECEVPGECVGQLVGFVEDDDPVRYED